MQEPPLSRSTKLSYGVGAVALGLKDNGFSYLLLLFYNQVVGMPAPTVGLAIMIALVADALLDPVIGQVSDNWRSRWGRRHPFMYVSALPIAVSYFLLWHPPTGWSDQAMFFYLIAIAMVIRTFIAVFEIPSSALGAELTSEYHVPPVHADEGNGAAPHDRGGIPQRIAQEFLSVSCHSDGDVRMTQSF